MSPRPLLRHWPKIVIRLYGAFDLGVDGLHAVFRRGVLVGHGEADAEGAGGVGVDGDAIAEDDVFGEAVLAVAVDDESSDVL